MKKKVALLVAAAMLSTTVLQAAAAVPREPMRAREANRAQQQQVRQQGA
jgi:Ni/Co efflux regulator RcnB